jgi:hypothetical protein
MKCEQKDCKRTAKLKLSMETGWCQSFCFMHAYKILKPLIKQVHQWNRGLYIQKVTDER